ncbi:ribonuclease J, partial [Candidatus Uhrbacteria bacterium]|nr:ribonuclease J [Candidatus Uhrbacteria bacterium]
TNIEIARELRYMQYPKGLIVETEELLKLPPERQMILCTGAMGQDRAALMRIANREHRLVEIEPGDTVIFSSSVIPGNERSVQRLKDNISRQGANVIHYHQMDVHSGGHAKQDDLKLMIKLVNPRYLIPIHGNYSFLVAHSKLGREVGLLEENILVPENGRVITFDRAGGRLTTERVPAEHVMVDGLGVGDVSDIVLRDRKQLADDGMLVVIVTTDTKTGKLVTKPDIISRGFIHLKESGPLIDAVQRQVQQLVEAGTNGTTHGGIESHLRNKIRDEVGQFLFQQTERRPMILPVVIEV